MSRRNGSLVPRVAVEHFSHALEAATQLTEQDSPDANLSAPLSTAPEAQPMTLGEFEAARADFEQVLAFAHTQQDRQAEWQSLLDLGFLWTGRDFGLAGEHFSKR